MLFLGILLGLIPFAIVPPTLSPEPFSEIKWPLAAAGVMFCTILMLREERKSGGGLACGFRFWREPFAVGAALIAVGLILSALLSPVPGLGLFTALREVFFVSFALGLALRQPNRVELRWIFTCLLLSMGLQAILALGQYFFPEMAHSILPLTARAVPGRNGMLGTIGNPEYLAGWLALGLSAATLLALGRSTSPVGVGRDSLRLLAAGVALLNLAAIFISGGRGAILATMGALGVVAIIGWIGSRRPRLDMDTGMDRGQEQVRAQRPRRIGWTVGLMAVGLLALAGLWAIQKPDARERTLPGRLVAMMDLHSPSMRHRIGLLAVTSRMIAEHPLAGVGPGRYGWGFSDMLGHLAEREADVGFWSMGDVLTGSYIGEAHCEPLQWWAEYGLLPILGLTLMIARALSGSWRVLGRRGDFGDPLTVALWVLIATMGLNMWVAFPLHGPVRALTFWTMLGLLAGCTRPGEED